LTVQSNLLQKARAHYGGDRDMIITHRLLDNMLRALDRMDRDIWREPRLHRVTPEAIAELEGNVIRTIGVVSQGYAKAMMWNTRQRRWYGSSGPDSPLNWQWFIDLAAIPEVTR
jgi:hypothetical protein